MISNPQVTPAQSYPQMQTQQVQVPQQAQQATQAQPPQVQVPQAQAFTPAPAMGPSASAVNIQIFNPQAYGSAAPIANPTAQYYNAVPQGSIYAPQQGAPAPYVPQSPVSAPAQYVPQPPVSAPAPAVMPNSVIAPENSAPTPAAPQAATPAPEVSEAPAVDIAGINSKLTSSDLNAQTEGIVQLAQIADQNSELSKDVIDNSIMTNLAGIIAQDTSSLQGPTQDQINVALKEQSGQALTPEEQQIAQQSSPKEVAEKNKVYAMYTLAMMQKQLRDEIDAYNAQNPQSPVQPLQMQNMTGFNEIQNAIATTQVPLVKAAGIEALGYVASKPEDKAVLDSTILAYANDPDPSIQNAVQEVYAKIGAPLQVQQQPQAPEAQAQEAPKKKGLFHRKKA